ncbi:hypothetical protein BBD42_00990 [Paenibacillus sp. BIHB 4019]|uniref:Uncharacterized protein n=1 Tax=Paenibacillus sp. BIHB 4019 TaxID=1870819 RepID=A0A1B2DBW5_9BACL|nr:hypothetical protein [Paenibacillus sp. BIHB 4019]ANY65210.1 hypothetical protein BBD42_00990 [Paenibacillus sp. BIHB 4019]
MASMKEDKPKPSSRFMRLLGFAYSGRPLIYNVSALQISYNKTIASGKYGPSELETKRTMRDGKRAGNRA